MKKSICLLLFFALTLIFAGCGDGRQESSQPEPPERYEMPTAASQPDTMPIGKLLYVVNELLGYEDEEGKIFQKKDAEAFNVPNPLGGEQTLYIFFIGDLEISIFADTENDCFIGAYVRSLLTYDDYVQAQVVSFAGVLLAAVEPNEFERMMLDAALATEVEDTQDVMITASGEAWEVVNRGTLINIVPKLNAD